MLLVYNPSLKVFELLFHFVLLWYCGKSIPERCLSNIIMLWWLWMLGCPKVAGLSIELYRMSDDIKYHSEVMIFSFLFFFTLYLFLNLYGIFGMCFFLFLKHPLRFYPFHLRLEPMNGSTMFACLRSVTSSDSKKIRCLSFFLSSLFPGCFCSLWL